MKKTTLLLSLFLALSSVSANEIRTEKTDILKSRKAVVTIDAVIEALDKDNTYAIEYSHTKLKSMTPPSILGNKSAKQVELGQGADYTFEIVAEPIGKPVITIMTVDEATFNNEPDPSYIAAMDFYSSFTVNVKNSSGEIIKTLAVSTKNLAHRYYLCIKLNRGKRTLNPIITDDIFDHRTTGWRNAAKLEEVFKQNEEYLLNSTYREVDTENMRVAATALQELFNNKTIPSNSFKIHAIKDSEQGELNKISTTIEELRVAAQKWATNQDDSQLKIQLAKYGDAFLGYAIQNKEKELRALCLANASLAYILSGNFDKALSVATSAVKIKPSIGAPKSTESMLYKALKTKSVYKNSNPVQAYLNYDLVPKTVFD